MATLVIDEAKSCSVYQTVNGPFTSGRPGEGGIPIWAMNRGRPCKKRADTEHTHNGPSKKRPAEDEALYTGFISKKAMFEKPSPETAKYKSCYMVIFNNEPEPYEMPTKMSYVGNAIEDWVSTKEVILNKSKFDYYYGHLLACDQSHMKIYLALKALTFRPYKCMKAKERDAITSNIKKLMGQSKADYFNVDGPNEGLYKTITFRFGERTHTINMSDVLYRAAYNYPMLKLFLNLYYDRLGNIHAGVLMSNHERSGLGLHISILCKYLELELGNVKNSIALTTLDLRLTKVNVFLKLPVALYVQNSSFIHISSIYSIAGQMGMLGPKYYSPEVPNMATNKCLVRKGKTPYSLLMKN